MAAAALGARRGFDAISMADIGAEAGIVGSGVYRHFDSKTAILVAMADRVMDRLMARSAEIIAAGLDERAGLTLLVRDHIEVALTDRDALAVYHREVRTLPEDERRRLSRAQRHYIRIRRRQQQLRHQATDSDTRRLPAWQRWSRFPGTSHLSCSYVESRLRTCLDIAAALQQHVRLQRGGHTDAFVRAGAAHRRHLLSRSQHAAIDQPCYAVRYRVIKISPVLFAH